MKWKDLCSASTAQRSRLSVCLLFRHTGLSLSSSLNHKSASMGWAAWQTKAGGCWGRGAQLMKVPGEHLWLWPPAEEKRGTGKWMEQLERVMVGSTVWNTARNGRGMGRNVASQWETNFEWSLKYGQQEGNSPKHCHDGCSVAIHRHADARCLEHRKTWERLKTPKRGDGISQDSRSGLGAAEEKARFR